MKYTLSENLGKPDVRMVLVVSNFSFVKLAGRVE